VNVSIKETRMPPAILLSSCGPLRDASWIGDLRSLGLIVTHETGAQNSIASLKQQLPRAVVVVAPPQDPDEGLHTAAEICRFAPTIPVILLVERSSEKTAIAALRAGITDYFHIPAELPELFEVISRIAFTASQQSVDEPVTDDSPFVGNSVVMQRVQSELVRVAPSNSNVLITGETGTGKELAASAIHRMSRRNDKPFVCVNCAAIPDALVESEMFGYERGAFTGALSRKSGWLQTADRGTIFLDEVGDLSLAAQAKLLRVLENKQFYPLGGKAGLSVDLRFIAATNRNLEEMIHTGGFRQDLYYRLNIARVHIPPLRERREDIPALLHFYIREYSRNKGPHLPEFTQDAWNCLLAYDWPGNVRELKNLVETAHLKILNGKMDLSALPVSLH